MRLGSNRRKALHNFGTRAGVDDLNSLANVLLQADRFGTAISTALRDMEKSIRHKRRQKAEERASNTAVTLLTPLILLSTRRSSTLTLQRAYFGFAPPTLMTSQD